MLSSFPAWLVLFKAVIAFMRDQHTKSILKKELKRVDAEAVSQLVFGTAMPHFTTWRWGTLFACLQSFSSYYRSLLPVFDAAWFKSYKETKRLKLVLQAFRSEAWLMQLGVISFITMSLTHIQSWGGGCLCHGAELIAGLGRICQCWKKVGGYGKHTRMQACV